MLNRFAFEYESSLYFAYIVSIIDKSRGFTLVYVMFLTFFDITLKVTLKIESLFFVNLHILGTKMLSLVRKRPGLFDNITWLCKKTIIILPIKSHFSY